MNKWLTNNQNQIGQGIIIEIDEAKFGREYNRERLAKG